MRRFGSWLVAGLLTAPAQLHASQPYSASMMECSYVLAEIVELGERKGADEELLSEFRALLLQFRLGVEAQARREGVTDVASYLDDVASTMKAKWSGRLSSIFYVQDNIDWLNYCDSFAGHLGLKTG